jgi:hypothetical protein
MDCDNCKSKQPEMVSRYAMEELAARQDMANRRSHRLNILLVILILLSWLGFAIWQNQFETVSTSTTTQDVEQQADGDGSNNFVGGDYYGNSAENQNNDNNDEIPAA